jgi:hypothetical protein
MRSEGNSSCPGQISSTSRQKGFRISSCGSTGVYSRVKTQSYRRTSTIPMRQFLIKHLFKARPFPTSFTVTRICDLHVVTLVERGLAPRRAKLLTTSALPLHVDKAMRCFKFIFLEYRLSLIIVLGVLQKQPLITIMQISNHVIQEWLFQGTLLFRCH